MCQPTVMTWCRRGGGDVGGGMSALVALGTGVTPSRHFFFWGGGVCNNKPLPSFFYFRRKKGGTKRASETRGESVGRRGGTGR